MNEAKNIHSLSTLSFFPLGLNQWMNSFLGLQYQKDWRKSSSQAADMCGRRCSLLRVPKPEHLGTRGQGRVKMWSQR